MRVHLYGAARLSTLALLIAALCVGLGGAGAQDAPQYDPMMSTSDVNVLRAEAARAGSLRVIVGVRANYGGRAGMDSVTGDIARSQISRTAQDSLLSSLAVSGVSLQVVRQFDYIPYMTLRVDAAALGALAAHPLVTSIENDALSMPDMQSSAGIIGASGAGGAWTMGYTGEGFTVAVLDTGVDKDHPALSGQVVAEACFNTTDPVEGSYSRCPGGGDSSTEEGSGADCDGLAAGCGHGTHVAGTVASTDATNRGIAPDATIIAINLFSVFPATYPTCDLYYDASCLLTSISDQIEAMNHVYALRNTHNIAAINMSLGGGDFTSEANCDYLASSTKAAIDLLRGVNIAAVISSGNNGHSNAMGLPGCISTAVSVGATEDDDDVASFSNVASFMEVFAPGVDITSAAAYTTGFEAKNGTSMAAPHVAGAWAVLREANPDATVSEILTVLTDTGVSVTDERYGSGVTKPRIQLNAALTEILTPYSLTGLAIPISQTAVSVSWNELSSSAGYRLEYSLNDSTDWVGIVNTLNTSHTHMNLDCDTDYYYRVIAYLGGGLESRPSKTVRATTDVCGTLTELLVNGSFEDNDAAPAKMPDNWNAFGQLKGDKVRGDGATITSYSPPNTFQFMGYAKETTSKLAQSVKLLAHNFEAGDRLRLTAYVDQRTAKPKAIFGQLVITYKNSSAVTTVKLRIPAVKSPGYKRVQAPIITLTNPNIKKISVQLLYTAPTGKFFVDSVSLTLIEPDALLSSDGLVPLPAAPGDLRGQ